MSVAATQAQRFYDQAVAGRRIYTFIDAGLLVFRKDGYEVVPFWSSQSRLDRTRARHPKYRAYRTDQATLDDFLDKTLP